ERRQHLLREQLKRRADVLVTVAARLLDEDHLIDANVTHLGEVAGGVSRCADAARVVVAAGGGGRDASYGAVGWAPRLELLPHRRAPGDLVVGDERVERVTEEFKSLLAAPDRFGAVVVAGEPGD